MSWDFFFLLWCREKQTSFKNICEKKNPHTLFPMPSLLSLNAHMPRITEKSNRRHLKEACPPLKKSPCWLLQGDGTGSSDTSPSCLSPFYRPVCPLISLLSLPSVAKKNPCQQRAELHYCKMFHFLSNWRFLTTASTHVALGSTPWQGLRGC